MKIKKFIAVFGLPLMLSTTLFAQEAPVTDNPDQDPAKRQGMMMQKLKTELSLTPQQETKINELWKKEEAETRAKREAIKTERQERRTQAEDRHKAHLSQMKAILTPDQYVRFLELKQERRMEHRSKGDKKRQGMNKKREGRPYNKPAGNPQ